MRHELLLTCCHILDFHLRPLISIKKRDARAQIFGGLELPGDFGWRERVIDAVAAVAQLLDLCQRVGTAFFLRNNYVDVDLAIVRYRFLHRFACSRDFVDQFAENDIAHCKTKRRQRKRAIAQLRNQIIVTPAAGDGAKLPGTIEHLEHDSGVIGKPTNDSHIDRHEIGEAASAQPLNELLQLCAFAAALQRREDGIGKVPEFLCRLLTRFARGFIDRLQ